MQDKTMMRFQYIPIRMAIITNIENIGGKIQVRYRATGMLTYYRWKCYSQKTVWQFLIKVKIHLHDPKASPSYSL